MNFLSGRKVYDLFDNSPFVDAIRKKDICDVKRIIRKTCGFHLDGILNTPVCKMLSVEAPDRFEIMKQQRTDELEKEVNLLAEIIFESGMGILPESEIDLSFQVRSGSLRVPNDPL